MATWTSPVFDRTQEDVDIAIKTIEEWINTDIAGKLFVLYDLKGCLNVSDINRIENNMAYLAETLISHGYYPNVVTKTWTNSGIPTQNDIERIIKNLRELLNSFYVSRKAPTVPNDLLSYEEVNAIEKNLFIIKELIEIMLNSFKVSGAFYLGTTSHLPLRR